MGAAPDMGCCGEDVDARVRVAARARATAERERGWTADPSKLKFHGPADAARAARLWKEQDGPSNDAFRVLGRWDDAISALLQLTANGELSELMLRGPRWSTGGVRISRAGVLDVHQALRPLLAWGLRRRAAAALVLPLPDLLRWCSSSGVQVWEDKPDEGWKRCAPICDIVDILHGVASMAEGSMERACSHFLAAGWVPARWLEGGAG